MHHKLQFLPLLLLLLLGFHLSAQCPVISTTTMTPGGCDMGCTLCEGDIITLTATGYNLPDGGKVDWYIDENPGFDPYSGEGTLLGSSTISTPVTPCNPPPSFIGMMIDACGPEAANEFMVFDAGGGFDVNDLLVDFDMNNNGGAGNEDLGNGFPCGFAPGNPNLVQGCDDVFSIGPGEHVPAGAILVLFTSTGSSTTYDMSGICPDCRKVYVLSSNCARTKGAFSNHTSSGTRTTNWSVACGGGGSITYDCADLVGDGDQWANGGVTNGTCDFEGGASPYQALSTVTVFTTTVPNAWCDKDYEIVGIISPWMGSNCCDDPYTDRFTLHISCPEAFPARIEACDKGDGTADFDLSSIESDVNGNSGYTVEWYADPGLNTPILISPYTSTSKIIYAVVRDGNCVSASSQVELVVLPLPVFAGNQQVELCEVPSGSGTAPLNIDSLRNVLNLGDNSLDIRFWEDETHTIEILDDPYNTGSGVIYFTVNNGQCTAKGDIIIIINPTPQAFPQQLMVCESPPGSGSALVDLNQLRSKITVGNPNNVSFYEQKDVNTKISSPYKTESTTLYARVEEQPCASEWVEIEVTILGNIDPNDAVVRLCATSSDSTATFTLQEIYDQINHGRPLRVFSDSMGADLGIFPYTGKDSIFFGQLENDSCTSGIFKIKLDVTARPILQNNTVAQICTDTNGLATFDLKGLRKVVASIDSTIELIIAYDSLFADTILSDTVWTVKDTTLYVVGFNGGCYSDTITIQLHPVRSPYIVPMDIEGCDSAILPPITGKRLTGKEAYYSRSQGAGMKWLAGDVLYTSGKIYAFDKNRFCPYENEINVTIHSSVHAGKDVRTSVCKGTQVDLSTLLDGADSGGAFRDVSGMGNLAGTMVNTTTLANGEYPYRYTRYSGTTCPDDSATITLVVVDQVNAGQDIDAGVICEMDTLFLRSLLTGDLGGEIHLLPSGQMLNNTDFIPAQDLGVGAHQLLYIVGDGNTCPRDTAYIDIRVAPLVSIPPILDTSTCGPYILPPIKHIGGAPFYYSQPSGSGVRYSPGDTLFTSQDVYITDPGSPCSEEVVFHVRVGAISYNTINGMLCPGTSIVINGTTYDETHPSGKEVLQGQNANGCDSIITISLTFYPPATSIIDTILCPGESLQVNGTTYDANHPAGTELLPNASRNNCDSMISIQLAFYKTDTTIIDQYCTGDEITIGGVVFNEVHATDTINLLQSAKGGCDSTIRVNLTFADAVEAMFSETICQGDSLIVNGTTYNENHLTGADTFPNQSAKGCDSILHVMISLQAPSIHSISSTLCPEASLVINGTTYNTSHSSGTEIIQNGASNGCDSIIEVNLAFYEYFLDSDQSRYTIEEGEEIQPKISTDMNYTKINWSPKTGLSCADCLEPVFSPTQTTTYTLTLIDANGCEISTSLTIVVKEKLQGGLFIPNTFSPNSDGQNEVFRVFADKNGGTIALFEIFDRWGERLYVEQNTAVNDLNSHRGWDGKFKGSAALPGVYIYHIVFKFPKGDKVIERVGSLTLLK